jgi:hypothetical protein
MGDNWYGLVLGEEMGPLSWSDLRGMAARGSLGRQQRIKSGPEAEWVAAESVPGLFDNLEDLIAAPRSASHDRAVAQPWYCELLGTEFGPLPWDEIRGMADRGMVRPNSRVRQEGEQEWRRAAHVEGLIAAAATDESTDFDITEPPSRRSIGDEADFEFAVSPAKASPPAIAADDAPGEATLATEADAVESTVPRKAEEPPPEDGLPRPSTSAPNGVRRPSAEQTQAIPPAPAEAHGRQKDFFAKFHRKAKLTEALAPASVQPVQTASTAATSPPAPKKPAAKAPARPPKRAAAKERVGISDASKRALLGLLALVCLTVVGYGGYLGIVALASMRGANYDEILAGYDRLYEQAKKAQTDPAISTNPQISMQFVSTLSRLRAPLQNAAPGTIDEKLNQAGTRLAELFSTAAAAPGSEQAEQRATVDADYQSLMASIRSELGDKK